MSEEKREKPLVSIITVCYNSEKYIRNTIESVLNQTYDNIEYIVVDGKSTDNTLDIIKEYEPKFNGKMKWISELDDGIYNAINKGINMTNGKIVGILNSDDWYDNETVKKIVNNYNENIDIYYGNIYWIRSVNNIMYKQKLKCEKLENLKKEMIIHHPASFINKRWYDSFRYDNKYEISADYKFFLKSFLSDASFKYIDHELTYMRQGGLSYSNRLKSLYENFLIKNEMLNNKYKHFLFFIKKSFIYGYNNLKNSLAKLILPRKIYIKLKILKWKKYICN